MKIKTTHCLLFVLLTFFSCHNKSNPAKLDNPQTEIAPKPVFDDGYPTQVSDVMLDSLYDFYFWLHHRDVTDRAITRFSNQLKDPQTDKLALLKTHRRLTVAYMMAYNEPLCTKNMKEMVKMAEQLPNLSKEEHAKNRAVEAYYTYWFDVTDTTGLIKMVEADSLMRLAVGKADLRSVQFGILKSDYLSKLGKQKQAVQTLDSAMTTLERLPISYPSVTAWTQLLRTFEINSSIGFKFSRARVYFDDKKWENHPIMGMVYDEGMTYFGTVVRANDNETAQNKFQETLHKGHYNIWKVYEKMIEICYQTNTSEKGLEYVMLLLNEPKANKANKAIACGLTAKIYADLKQPLKVDEYAQKAKQYARQSKMLLQDRGHLYFHLTYAYKLLNHPDKTIFYGEKALPLYEKALGFNSGDYNDIAFNLAYQYAYYKNDFEKGLDYANKAVSSIAYDEKDVNLDNVSDMMMLNFDYLTLCTVLSLKFRYDRDSATYTKAENTLAIQYRIFEAFNRKTQGRAFKSRLFNTLQQSDWAINRNLIIGNNEKALYHAERFRFMRMRGGMGFNPSTFNLPKENFERETQLRTEIANLKKQISEQGETKILQEQLSLKARALTELGYKLQADYPQYYKLKYKSEPASLPDIQREVLDEQTALIEYFVGDSSIYVFTVLKNDLKAIEIPKGKDFEQNIEALRAEMTQGHPNRDATVFAKQSSTLYDKILRGPLSALPTTVSKLIIVPDGVLSYLPFEILMSSDKQNPDFRKNDFLLKHYQISYAYSANLLMEQKRVKKHDAKQLFAGFAPKYENKDTLIASANMSRATLTRDGAYELKGAKEEVNTISQLIGGQSFVNESATEGVFKKEANQYRILHFAMHSLTDDKDPTFSKLLFTLTPKDTTNDNDLTAGELYAMQLNADLAVLSACNTGYGKLSRGEGVMSLARAFTYAGVPATVTSLWKVPDLTTREIMVDFYKNLKSGMTKDAALRAAKLTYLENAPESIAANPFFWAGFVPMGNMEAMDMSASTPLSIWGIFTIFLLISGFVFWRKGFCHSERSERI